MKVLTLLVKRKVCYTRNALFSPFLCKAFIVFDVGCIINCTLTSHVVHSLCFVQDLGSQGFGDLLATIRNKNIPLQNMHFVVTVFNIYVSIKLKKALPIG